MGYKDTDTGSGSRTERQRKDDVLAALAAHPLDLEEAARIAGVYASTVEKWMRESPKFREEVRAVAKAHNLKLSDIQDHRNRRRLDDIRDGVVKDKRSITQRKADMLWAFRKKLGIESTALELACIDRAEHRKWLESSPQYKADIEDVLEWKKDVVEEQLLLQTLDGSVTAQRIFLEAQAPERGYGNTANGGNDMEKITKIKIDWGK